MKKFLLFIALLMVVGTESRASHLMGGQITAEHVGTDSCLVTLTIYRDTLGINVDTTNYFEVYPSAQCNNRLALINFHFDGYSYIGNGVEEYVFTKYLTPDSPGAFYFPDTATASYFIKWENCCRNHAINNITNPGSNSMVLQTEYKTFGQGIVNSTPVFLNQPVTAALNQQPWQYNPLPYDADGDSLYWYIDTPWKNCQTVCPGYTMPAAMTGGAFAIDHATGQITWTPSTVGNWNATVMVDEYRNGQKIGFIRRDMQILVLDSTAFSTGTPANLVIGGSSVQSQQQLNFNLTANNQFNLITSANDVDNDNLLIQINGEPFILSENPATYTINNGQGTATASFTWKPLSNQARVKPYDIAVRIQEKNPNALFSRIQDITVRLKVDYPTGVKDLVDNKSLTVGPNPANQYATINFTTDRSASYSLKVIDLTGRVCQEMQIDARSGVNAIILPTSQIQDGIYLLQISNGTENIVSKLSIQH